MKFINKIRGFPLFSLNIPTMPAHRIVLALTELVATSLIVTLVPTLVIIIFDVAPFEICECLAELFSSNFYQNAREQNYLHTQTSSVTIY